MIPILEMEGVKYNIRDRKILDLPSFELYEGEWLGIMGPNGAGKSTFLKLLAFLENQSAGSIRYRGEKWTAASLPLPLRRRFSVALQQSLLLQGTVFENVAIGLKLRGEKKAGLSNKVMEMLELFDIHHLAKKSSNQLSGGEAQRVNLARALVTEPEVLFLDEPFSALDFPTKVKLIEDFQRIIELTRTTTVLISHDLLEIQSLSKRLLLLMDGEMAQVGPTKQVIQNPNPLVAEFLQPWTKHFPILTH
ncbi:ABC transporter ATP-binding protein [Neobacillus sp. D3-1R]|uniref:ABC transporter ATP-binding protein n=1 Tax=Neobacillus sp. D3-1R TaxID=3445778 RepID=UPI003F9F505B